MNTGSIWRRWDLHIHTPESFENSFSFSDAEKPQYSNVWDKYVAHLENINDIAVIGVTDYFSIEGYRKVREYKNQGRLNNFAMILPNIEFRLDKYADDKKVNFHVIFSDEIEPDVIDREFLGALQVKTPSSESRMLNRETILEIGRDVKRHNLDFKNRTDYQAGCLSIHVNLDDIIKKLDKALFCNKYLLVLAEAGWNEISWKGQAYALKRQILSLSDAVFSSNPSFISWSSGNSDLSAKKFIAEFKGLKPCLHGSDAHRYDQLGKPDNDRFCWIKADTTFEGLRQILYEPEERVRIGRECPETRKSIFTLSSIAFDRRVINNDLTISKTRIDFNPNLVAITGGKGCGKTALLDLLVHTFQDRSLKLGPDNKSSFISRIEKDASTLDWVICFNGETVLPFRKRLNDGNFFGQTRIEYLPQGRIEQLSADAKKLSENIREKTYANASVIEGGFKRKDSEFKSRIESCNNEILSIIRQVVDLTERCSPEHQKKLEDALQLKEGELTNKKQELEAVDEYAIKNSIDMSEPDKLIEDERVASVRLSSLITIRNDMDEYKRLYAINLRELNVIAKRINDALTEIGFEAVYPIFGEVATLDSAITVEEKLNAEVALLEQQINDLRVRIRSIGELAKQKGRIVSLRIDIEGEIKELKVRKIAIDADLVQIEVLRNNLKEKYIELVLLYSEWRKLTISVIDLFSQGKQTILEGVNFTVYIHVNSDEIKDRIDKVLDGRRKNLDEERSNLLAKLLEIVDNETNFSELLETFLEYCAEYKNNFKQSATLFDYYFLLFGDYFEIRHNISFDGIPLEKLSMGQRGTVLLKLILAEGDWPILLDQPEEQLDNRFVFSHLVGAIRHAKHERQIIIATNNANLVVASDAEQIIIVSKRDNTISYDVGTLEDLEMRKELIPVLEGGKNAFTVREKRYGAEGWTMASDD